MNWQSEMDDLKRREAFAEELGGPERVKRQHDGGRYTIRERLATLCDPGSFHEIGKIARPVHVWIVPDMPKTRSGKIMRRVIAAISNFAEVGDVSTLANPEIVDDIKQEVQSEKLARGTVPRQLTPEETAEILAFGGTEE